MFERKKQAMDSKCRSSMPEEGSYMYIGSYLSHSKRYPESEYLSTQRKKREVRLPSRQIKGSDPGYRKDYVRIKIGFTVEHTEHGNMVKSERFQETDLAFLCRCAQSSTRVYMVKW